ncbi:hypothetical protein K443DRAFT_510161, partial [Laccaria amethystina LaAM-08-1]
YLFILHNDSGLGDRSGRKDPQRLCPRNRENNQVSSKPQYLQLLISNQIPSAYPPPLPLTLSSNTRVTNTLF